MRLICEKMRMREHFSFMVFRSLSRMTIYVEPNRLAVGLEPGNSGVDHVRKSAEQRQRAPGTHGENTTPKRVCSASSAFIHRSGGRGTDLARA